MTEAKKTYSKDEIDKILEENRQLSHEVASLNKIINSRRFRFADKVGNLFNRLAPEHTARRSVLKAAYAPIRAYKNHRDTAVLRKIQKLSSNYSRVIVMHSIPWNVSLKQRPHHLAARLAEHDLFVIYFEPDEALTKFRKISDNFITTNSLSNILNLAKKKNTSYYFFLNNVSNIALETVDDLKKSGYQIVYEYIDEFHEDISGTITNQLDIWNNIKKIAPAAILASADKLFADAVKQYRKDRILLSKNAVNIGDFDYHNYEDAEAPSDLIKILSTKHPVVGYYGAISPWLNYELIHKSAKANPDFEFVFIGVNYQDSLKYLDTSINNIHFLGPKDYSKLPLYSCKFDCAIIPFNYGEIAKGTSPVKLFEYMAMGLPTVCTRDLLECYNYKHVLISDDDDAFIENLRKAVKIHGKPESREKLLSQAQQNSWRSRANDIVKYLDDFEKK